MSNCCISQKEFIKKYALTNELNIFLSSLIFSRKSFEDIGGFKDIVQNGLAMDVLFNIEILNECGEITILYEPLWQYRTFVSDWCGAITDSNKIFTVANEYINYRSYIFQFFKDDLLELYPYFCRKRIHSQIIGVCFYASKLKTCSLILKKWFSLKDKIFMLRDIIYMFRH